ncbi:ABC transporter permease [Pararhodonellum marinum]|uniref:ABC transporter permease n=1 Tax=Pararhodonellum marinum TaxID=2755358 RepID=UPI0018909648|nr:ABC transporter permease [Pararhodonellum marinum]
MLKNYFLTAWRIMGRQKAYTAINIMGFSLGIATFMLIVIYVVDELSYDKFHPDAENIYRISMHGRMSDNDFEVAMTPNPMAQALVDQVPEVEDAIRFGLFRTMPIQYEDKTFTEPRMLASDPGFFDFFGFSLLEGNPETALVGPNKVVLTQSTAKKYFGEESPIGKIILRGSDKKETEVSGVMEDVPHHSHMAFDLILSGESWDYMKTTQWTSNNLYTYFKTYPDADLGNVQAALDNFVIKNFGPELEQFMGVSLDIFLDQGNKLGYQVMNIRDIHLRSDVQEEIKPTGSIQYLYIFGAVAFFIIIIACINFMNLSTARSANRAKEVGVRKTIGAKTSKLIGQFLSESILYSAISTFIALFLVLLALRPFNVLSGKSLGLGIFADPLIILSIIGFAIIVGILAGSYPAFYLTSFSPVNVLKGKIRSGAKRSNFRNGLVVFQFFISICLIISSLVVYQQLRYLQEKNLGFDKESVINLLHTRSLGQNAKAFKDELNGHTDFVAASFANRLPPNVDWNSVFRNVETGQDFLCNLYFVDHEQAEAMGYKMADGRFFSRDFPSDTSAVIINETAFRQMGWKELDGAQRISGFWGNNDEPIERQVVGVIKDFNFESLKLNVRPLIITLGPEPNDEMAIKLSSGNVKEKITILENIWKKYSNGAAFEYSFVDANFEAQFRSEQKMGNIILVFTILAIGIACLGLFGLAAYTTEQRSKEISIRKALGASVTNLVTILSKDFTLLVLISFLFAGPLTYYLMNHYWLQNFPFRIEINVLWILLAGVLSIIIAWLTVSYQSFRTAARNPVDYLKNE